MNEEKAIAIVMGDIASSDKPIVAIRVLNILNPLETSIPQKIAPKSNATKPNKILLSKVKTVIEPCNNRRLFVSSPNTFALMVPKCKLVPRRPEKIPPITPLMLRIPG